MADLVFVEWVFSFLLSVALSSSYENLVAICCLVVNASKTLLGVTTGDSG